MLSGCRVLGLGCSPICQVVGTQSLDVCLFQQGGVCLKGFQVVVMTVMGIVRAPAYSSHHQ